MEARQKTGPVDLCPQRWLLGRHYRHVLLLQTKMIKLNAAEIREIKRERENDGPDRLLQTIHAKLDKRNAVFSFLLSLTLLSICLDEIAVSWYKSEIQVTHPLK